LKQYAESSTWLRLPASHVTKNVSGNPASQNQGIRL
jgi:hypothetical protein